VRRCKRGQRVHICGVVVALAAYWIQAFVGNKSKPGQVLEDRGLEFATAANPIVIFNPQPHASGERSSQSPHVDGVDDVPQVQIAGGRGGEAGGRRHGVG
jgi:hypothetical protein